MSSLEQIMAFGFSSAKDEKIKDLEKEIQELKHKNEELRFIMTAVSTLPGKDWLLGALALGEALDMGGKHLNRVLERYNKWKQENSEYESATTFEDSLREGYDWVIDPGMGDH